ncbi:hypothetical protein [Gimesia chilikensis]|uniref:Uncharacterized protein n=1 Tax=Gimesia chilikensis TaxID=2605989 RepID=A0A517PSX9_9PLAN|nr:hypothetical protein [Gimesia chilikensis]QDT22473.1 hypothetical protein HG66A1_42810 [Gimesia chilikensis]
MKFLKSLKTKQRQIIDKIQFNMQMIATGATGKTAIQTAWFEHAVDIPLPSGLTFGTEDPMMANEILQDLRRRRIEAHSGGYITSQDAYKMRFELCDAENVVAELHTNEAIGQVLTGTTSGSSEQELHEYDGLLNRASNSHALLPMVAPPPLGGSQDDELRFMEDNRLVAKYLSTALRHHGDRASCSVGIVMTKLDTLFDSEEEARSELTDELLMRWLRPLVQVVNQSQKVFSAAIIPTSAFGWQNAEPIPSTIETGATTMYRLKDRYAEPYNTTPLLLWTLLNGLLPVQLEHTSAEQEAAVSRVVHMLDSDLEHMPHWSIPIKEAGRSLI